MALAVVESGVVEPSTPGGAAARWVATGRDGGVSRGRFASANLATHVGDDPVAVARNRELLAATIATHDLAVLSAEHGAQVVIVGRAGSAAPADAMITDRPGLALAALAADCATIALIGDDDRSIGVVHCGWRGLALGVVGAAVEALNVRGVGVLAAVVGPAVCGQCYPVPADRVEQVRRTTSPEVADAAIVVRADGQPGIDVGSGVVMALREVAPAALVTRSPRCTVEDRSLFSHRRDGVTGRHALVVVREVA